MRREALRFSLGRPNSLVEQPETVGNVGRKLLRFRAGPMASGQFLQCPLDKAGDLFPVPALVGFTELGVQGRQLADAPVGGVLTVRPGSPQPGLSCPARQAAPEVPRSFLASHGE